MANGATARLPFTSELPSDNGPISAKPSSTALEVSIGMAVESAVTALAQAMVDYQHCGVLLPATKEAGGSRIAKVAELWLSHEGDDLDFATKVRTAGKRALRRHLPIDFPHSPAAIDAALEFYINELLGMVGRVVANERARAH